MPFWPVDGIMAAQPMPNSTWTDLADIAFLIPNDFAAWPGAVQLTRPTLLEFSWFLGYGHYICLHLQFVVKFIAAPAGDLIWTL